MIRWLLLVLLIPVLAQASTIVRCDPIDPKVPNRVTQFRQSVNTPDFEGLPNVLINPTITVTDPPFRYWKCNPPSDVVNMTAQEKTDLDADRDRDERQVTDDTAESITARTKLRQDFIDWDTMTAGQRQDATKNILRFLLLKDRIERGGQ